MSSTNRSNARDSHISDYYVTPQSAIRDFLTRFFTDEGFRHPEMLLTIDPCAGGDENNEMSYPSVLKEFGITPWTIDIREDSLADTKEDYLNITCVDSPDMIITNPPFNKALDIVKKALRDVNDDGYVVMLLRLNFFGSKERFPFWQENMPKYAYVHHKRMSFTSGGGTDSIEYMHCVWQKGYKGDTILKVI